MLTGFRVAVIGSGPAGFYATQELLATGVHVDLYDVLPTPFGLVRAGVAPDHPKIKSVARVFEKTAEHERFRFFGGVEFGVDVQREDLLERYHALIYAVGAAKDRRMGIPGEDRPGSVAATAFVAWYNGHPEFADHRFDLSTSRAVVIGNGNVAIDIARILIRDPEELAATDAADHAVAALSSASVEHVTLVGRRGPAQAAFTNQELSELGELSNSDVVVDHDEIALDVHSAVWLESDRATPAARRNVEVLREFAEREPRGQPRRIELRFLRSPVEVVGGADGSVVGLRVARNRLRPSADGDLQAVPAGEIDFLECGLVIRSIGYRGAPLPGVPFDEHRGLIRNNGGRVTRDDGEPLPGEYAVGWISRGPSGVIGTNKKDAVDTVARLVDDAAAGLIADHAEASADIEAWLRGRVPDLVVWEDWQSIDQHERALGKGVNRPRVKLVRVPEMLAVAERARGGARRTG